MTGPPSPQQIASWEHCGEGLEVGRRWVLQYLRQNGVSDPGARASEPVRVRLDLANVIRETTRDSHADLIAWILCYLPLSDLIDAFNDKTRHQIAFVLDLYGGGSAWNIARGPEIPQPLGIAVPDAAASYAAAVSASATASLLLSLLARMVRRTRSGLSRVRLTRGISAHDAQTAALRDATRRRDLPRDP